MSLALALALLLAQGFAGGPQAGVARVSDPFPGAQLLQPGWAPWVAVTAYPWLAKCDGSDEHLVVQAALSDAGTTALLLPCGKTCGLGTSGINIPTGKSVLGCGLQSSILKCTGGTCVTRDGVQGTALQGLTIYASGASPSLVGLLDTNASGAWLRNLLSSVRVIGDQSPPVAGSTGIFIHSVGANSLYYGKYDFVEMLEFDKCARHLGDDGTNQSPPVLGSTGGANAQKWIAPQADACVTGFSFEGYASSNWVEELHCNGGGQAYDQLCLSVGDGTNATVAGNRVDLYADNSVGGHVGRSYAINGPCGIANKIVSYSSSSIGTNSCSATTDKNVVVELHGASGRASITVGNVQMLADAALGGIYISPSSGSPGIIQCNATSVANNVACVSKTNVNLAAAGDLMWSWRNNSGQTNSTDLRTGGAGTDIAAIDLNGGLRQAGVVFANIGAPAQPPNGTLLYCSDCTVANPCAGGGTGAFAKRLNGAWVCN